MSIDFDVFIKRTLNLAELKLELQKTVKELLHLSCTPTVCMNNDSETIDQVGDNITFNIENSGEAILTVLKLPYDETNPYKTKPTANISIGSLRTEESLSLVIALSIALSKLQKTNLMDDAELLSNVLEVNPTQLLKKIRLVDPQSDYSRASHILIDKLGWIPRTTEANSE